MEQTVQDFLHRRPAEFAPQDDIDRPAPIQQHMRLEQETPSGVVILPDLFRQRPYFGQSCDPRTFLDGEARARLGTAPGQRRARHRPVDEGRILRHQGRGQLIQDRNRQPMLDLLGQRKQRHRAYAKIERFSAADMAASAVHLSKNTGSYEPRHRS